MVEERKLYANLFSASEKERTVKGKKKKKSIHTILKGKYSTYKSQIKLPWRCPANS